MAIPTHNCAAFLREALLSVLQQDPGRSEMQIEVIDDCSTKDDPEAVVLELGRGRVQFYRQPENVGHVRNFETCLQRSTGRIVHILHGDDRVRTGFYSRLQRPFLSDRDIGMAVCRHLYIDSRGHWIAVGPIELDSSGPLKGFLEKMAIYNRVQTPAVVVRREVYEKLGAFDRRLSYCEDWEMWVRICAHYRVWHEVEPLAEYRLHGQSSSGRHLRSVAMLPDLRRAMGIMRDVLPSGDSGDSLLRRSRACHARTAIVMARDLMRLRMWKEAAEMAGQALRMDPTPMMCCLVLHHLLQASLERLYRSPDELRESVDRRLPE